MAKKSKNIIKNEVNRIVRRKFGRFGGIGLVLIVIVFLIGLVNPELRIRVLETLNPPLPSATQSPLKEGTWPVVHVVDGDTLDVQDDEGTKHRIRIIGADTPETVKPNHPVEPYGPEASAFTKKTIAESDNRVRVAFDGDQVDRYGRNLAMIYVQTADGEVNLSELLIRQGLARAQLQYRFSKGAKAHFQAAEYEA